MTEDVNGETGGNMHAFEGKRQVQTVIKKITLVDEKNRYGNVIVIVHFIH